MKHQIAAIIVLKYLGSTVDLRLVLKPQSSMQLAAHVDANWSGEPGTGIKSRSRAVIYYGSAMRYYRSLVHKFFSLSSAEAEYVTLSESTKAVLWLQASVTELGKIQQTPSIVQKTPGR